MNLGKGFLFSQENGVTYNGDPWIPVTPQKPVMWGSNLSPVELQGNQTRSTQFPELLGSCTRFLPEKPVMWRSNPIQSSELQVNQQASSSMETLLGSRSKFLPEKPVVQSSNSIHAEMQGNHIGSTNRQKSLGIFSTFSPEKQITRSSYPIATGMQGNERESTNWQELLGVYSNLLQQTTKSDTFHNLKSTRLLTHGEPNIQGGPVVEANGCFNYNADSYLQNFSKDIPVRDSNPLVQLQGMKDAPYPLSADQQPNRSIHPTNKLLITSSYSPVGNNWTEHQSVSTMLQNQTLDPNQGISSCSLQQMPSDAFPSPYQPSYNMNSPPGTETLGASCTTNCFQIAPLTPDQGKQLKNHQLSTIDNFSADGSPSQEKDKQEITSTDRQEIGNHCDQLLQSVIASPPPSNSTSLKERNIFEDGGYGGIDLNKTPQQKPPKRKKHRPKVVVEGKPKRTPKSTPSKTKISNETPTGKRKYVRKKDLRDSTSQQGNETKPDEAFTVQSAAKSCRRVLNFDVEDKMQEKGQDKTGDNQPESQHESFDLNLTSQGTTSSMGLNGISTIPAAKEEQQKRYNAGKQQNGSTGNLINATNQKSAEKFLPLAHIAPLATARDHTLNVIARTINLQNTMQHQTNNQYGYSQVHQRIQGEAMGQMPLQANTDWAKLDRAKQLMLQTRSGSVKGVAEANEKRGYKRDYCNISDLTHSPTVNLMHLQLSGEPKNDSRKSGIGTSETHKKKKFEDKCHEAASSMPSCTVTVKHSSRQVESRGSSGVHVSSSPYANGRLPYSNLEIQNSSRKQTSGANGIASDEYTDPIAVGNNFQEQRSLSEVKLQRDCMAGQFFQQYTESHSPSLLIGITDRNMLSQPQRVPITTQANETRTPEVDKAVKRQIVGQESSVLAFSKEKLLPKDYKKETGYLPFSRKARGQNEEHAMEIDEIICQLKGLQISNSGQAVVRGEQTALILYKGDHTIVPYEGFDPIRRRKPRPKVDLDPETNRLWNLLMGKPGSESTKTMEKDKEKWWEEERKVFRGRIDSFIARMHLVQGDRRFSRWKGSVVDSVIGVFLTQNVSDHLSSSAFMSLAAKFPLPRTLNPTSTWIEEPEVQIIDPDGTITYHGRILRQPLYKHNSRASSESSEQRSDHLITETGIHSVKENYRATEEEVFSSQNSSESLILQANEDLQSSSDSEVEDQVIMCNANKSQCPKNILQTEGAASLQQHQSHEMRSSLLDNRPIPECQKQPSPVYIRQDSSLNIGSDVYGYPINSNVLHLQGSFAPSSGFWLNKTSENGVPEPYSSVPLVKRSFSLSAVEAAGVAHGWRNIEHTAGSINSSTTQETGIPSHALTMGENTYPKHQSNLQPASYFRSSQQCISNDQEGSSKSFQQKGASETEARRPDEAGSQRQTGHMHPSSEPLGSESTKIPNLRKRKLDEKIKSFDWDTLRKQVLSKDGNPKRGKDKMDSLNYEVLRHADVKKISDAIKERGMNNMLAERIKDFLHRLVRDHGSIDLEWLRDVPPDKAKEYLLSIRGLGLKSVECVRLLTLHHMAFPVDTNVGRIAVRLGWVPLQPLPESLQLHLLELYPVLESIQKYLWPRLCKLDQRTLYELHYQMITFGKVFCTKNKPNCNACPMRAECRHFASAFASARLALPGPEERSIVSSTSPVAANGSPTPVLKPMPLPPPETNVVREPQYISSQWEPIIEEPTTPEPSTEVSESDIEDMLSEDTDEIPTIDLSFEQLKTNVRKIMQERNKEIPEGDLSRALVALNPADASIPAPKLKNVSRLRTEHQVYEIPDSHPLLKGMDRRDPDDPSPYLLAIWTPGETANSTETPESKCSFQGTGRLCNEKTCFSCNSIREANSQTVRGTLLIPCRTAMRGSFPLNGTYFQVNEVFADHESSVTPIDVPRDWLWPLPRRTVYFGTSVSTIFRGLSIIGIQYCFWKGFVCVRGFDLKTRAPRPLMARLHYPASKKAKNKNENK